MSIALSAIFGVMGICTLFYGERLISQAGKETQETRCDTLNCSGTKAMLAGMAFISLTIITITTIQY